MDCRYVELVTGSISNRNQIVTIDKVTLSKDRRECYRSLFIFDQDFARYVQQSGSTASYQGLHTAEDLVFDFDNEGDLAGVATQVVSFIETAEAKFSIPPEYWQIAFSGFKGFHATLPLTVCGSINASVDFAAIYKHVCMEMAEVHPFVDPSIYHMNRVIRMTGSINRKSGLFKVPVTLSELKTLPAEDIKAIARQPRILADDGRCEIRSIPSMESLWQRHSARPVSLTPSKAQEPSHFAPAVRGERNNRAMSISGLLIERGFQECDAVSIISLWNRQNPDPLPEQELQAIVRGAFKRYAKSAAGSTINLFSLADAEKEYERIVDAPENEKVRFGFPSLDRRIRAFTAGMVCSIVAKSSNGKSAFLQFLLQKHARKSGRPVIFFSLEMSQSLVYERAIQLEAGISGNDVERLYKTDRAEGKRRSSVVQGALKTFFVYVKSGITVDEIAAVVKQVEADTGQQVSLIGIDYISLLAGGGRDSYEKTTANAIALKQLAKNLSIPVIFLAQTTKDKSLYEKLNENAGKDSATILEASDVQLTLWREQSPPNSLSEWINFGMSITKNRSGHQGAVFAIRMNKRNLRWEEISSEHAAA